MLLTKEVITHKFLEENDGKLVWIRDDYLLMNGIQGVDDPSYAFLNHVWEVKKEAEKAGIVFSA